MGLFKNIKKMKNVIDIRPERLVDGKCSEDEFIQELAKVLYREIALFQKCNHSLTDCIKDLDNEEEIKKANDAIEAILSNEEEGWEKLYIKMNHFLLVNDADMFLASRAEAACDGVSTIKTINELFDNGYKAISLEEITKRMREEPSFRKEIEKYATLYEFEIADDRTFQSSVELFKNLSRSFDKYENAFTEDFLFIYEDGTVERDPRARLCEYNFDKVAFLFDE